MHDTRDTTRHDTQTNTGSILVSVNPFKQLPIYTKKAVKLYIGKSIIAPELRPPPHIFATAEACYYQMRESLRNQSVVIRYSCPPNTNIAATAIFITSS